MDRTKRDVAWLRLAGTTRTLSACLLVLTVVAACVSIAEHKFEAVVEPSLTPAVASVPDAAGNSQPVAASRDAQGIQSDFVEGVILVKPDSEAELQDFVARYGGTVTGDDAIPAPPPSLGITLSDEQRKPRTFAVRVTLASVDAAELAADARAAELDGTMAFSSEAGRQTFAQVLDARAAGFAAMPDYIMPSHQAFPQTMFATQERLGPPAAAGVPPVPLNTFTEPRYAATGLQTNANLAWQFVLAHGIQRPAQIAIIDSGFWLTTAGLPNGADSDLPAAPIQYDFQQDDRIADGAGTIGCGAGNPCFWHGTGSSGVATGIANNNLGYAGTGAFIATPMLFKRGTRLQDVRAVRTAVAWGADVVNMSFGGDCNLGCRIFDRDHTPFSDAVGSGSRIVFVASAGNGRGNPAAGYDVGDPSFVHPCIEDHVICVGALNDTTPLAPQGYSNFGARVNIFAPTNLPVMSYPPSFDGFGNPLPIALASGAEQPQTFGGTSAAAPFVSGVAAMIKAINPDLNSDAVGQILMDTSRPGTGQATRVIDALAAVRRAAEGIAMVNDRFENNSLETNPTNLGAAPPFNQPNLNINSGDRDYFRFDAPGGSVATIDLSYSDPLGPVSIFSFDSLGANCGAPALTSDAALPVADPAAPGRRLTYAISGGPHLLALKGTDINAYNLAISFAARAFAPDAYEVNDTVAQAVNLRSWVLTTGLFAGVMFDPRITIDANIHVPTDVDHYIVRGARIKTAEQVFLLAYSSVQVYGNDSPINLQVFRLNPDGTAGAQVANVGGGSCAVEPLEVRLDPDVYYLVRVSGSTGNYTLKNGVFGDKRRFPILVRDRVYEVLHPGEPIEHAVRQPELYVFAANPTHTAVRTPDPRAHLRLLNLEGNVIAEGVSDERGERLSLADIAADGIYAVEVVPQQPELQAPVLALRWEQKPPMRQSDNLVKNPGAEMSYQVGWESIDGMASARVLAYGGDDSVPTVADPGPPNRGAALFAGGRTDKSGMRQRITIDQSWADAIGRGNVEVVLSAYLGGYRTESDFATATIRFIGNDQQTLGSVSLPSVDARERAGETGLWPAVIREVVPAGTVALELDVTFTRVAGHTNDGYADDLNVSLIER